MPPSLAGPRCRATCPQGPPRSSPGAAATHGHPLPCPLVSPVFAPWSLVPTPGTGDARGGGGCSTAAGCWVLLAPAGRKDPRWGGRRQRALHPAQPRPRGTGGASASLGNWFLGRGMTGSPGSRFRASRYPPRSSTARRGDAAGVSVPQGQAAPARFCLHFCFFLWKNAQGATCQTPAGPAPP